MRRAVVIAVAVLSSTGSAATAWAAPDVPGPDQEAAEQAQAEIADARSRADEATAALWQAQADHESLTARAAELTGEHTALQQQVDALRAQVEAVAVNRFVASGSAGIPILTGYRRPHDQLQVEALVDVVTQSSADAMDAYDDARAQLEAKRAEVAANQAELVAAQAAFEEAKRRAETEVVQLEATEAQRLEDERVYLAALAERRAAEEQARREAAAAQAAAEAQYAAAPVPEGSGGGEHSSDDGHDHGGDGGGGGGGWSGGLACPVQGSSSYVDTYGANRSGGRSHQGVDMIASSGTPIVASVSGSVSFSENRLGGNSATLRGDDGNSYYYAHLSGYEGSSRVVSAGEVIGYVGMTGNAPVPHLHFEVRPGGGSAVNPYGSVRGAGC